MQPLVVIGSINQDAFAFVDELPRPGETVLARSASIGLGGKGCNQAMAAALAGAAVSFVGAVGTDAAGEFALTGLAAGGVGVAGVQRIDGALTGAAYITVNVEGENSIVVTSGANALVTADAVTAALDGADDGILLMQGELPADVVAAVAGIARARGLRFVLNLAPVSTRDEEVLASADPLIVNETEAADLLGADVADPHVALRDRYGVDVVVTVGARGALVASAVGTWRQPSPVPLAVVDTTGAGDAFVGALAAALAAGLGLAQAVGRGVVAASHSVSGAGTVTSYAASAVLDARDAPAVVR